MTWSCQAHTDDCCTPSQLSIATPSVITILGCKLNSSRWILYVELQWMDFIATNMENDLFLSSRHWWLIHAFPIIDCRSSVFDIVARKLNSSRWIWKLPLWRINCSCQADTHDSYTPSQLFIAAHLFLISVFHILGCKLNSSRWIKNLPL